MSMRASDHTKTERIIKRDWRIKVLKDVAPEGVININGSHLTVSQGGDLLVIRDDEPLMVIARGCWLTFVQIRPSGPNGISIE